MKKKLLNNLVVGALAVSCVIPMAACGKKDDDKDSNDGKKTAAEEKTGEDDDDEKSDKQGKKGEYDYSYLYCVEETDSDYIFLDKNQNVVKYSKEKGKIIGFSADKEFYGNAFRAEVDKKTRIVDVEGNILYDGEEYTIVDQDGPYFTGSNGDKVLLDAHGTVLIPAYESIRVNSFTLDSGETKYAFWCENDDDSYDVYTDIFVKLCSNMTGVYDNSFQSYLPVTDSNGFYSYVKKDDNSTLYISGKTGEVIYQKAKDQADPTFAHNHHISILWSKDNTSVVSFYDDDMNLVKTMDANYTDTKQFCGTMLLYSSDASSTVYDYNANPVFTKDFYLKGEGFGQDLSEVIFYGNGEVYNKDFELIRTLQEGEKVYENIYINSPIWFTCKDKKYTAFDTKGNVLLENIDTVDNQFVKADKKFYAAVGTDLVECKDAKTKPTVSKLKGSANDYLIRQGDACCVYSVDEHAIIWECDGKVGNNYENGLIVKDKKYYDHKGNLVYEPTK